MEPRFCAQEKAISKLQSSVIAFEKTMLRIKNCLVESISQSHMMANANKKRLHSEVDYMQSECSTSTIATIHSTLQQPEMMIKKSNTLKSTPQYKLGSLKGLCVEQVVKDWYTYQLYTGRFTSDSKSDDIRRFK